MPTSKSSFIILVINFHLFLSSLKVDVFMRMLFVSNQILIKKIKRSRSDLNNTPFYVMALNLSKMVMHLYMSVT